MPTTRRFEPGRYLTQRGWWVLPALLATALALPWVFGDRWYTDASYYQAISTQAARQGDWWSLMQGDLHYFNKPPLMFWVHGVLVAAFGSADWAVHAPEAVGYVLTCVLVAWLGKRLHGPMTGVLAGCAMALTNDWLWRIANFKLDIPHTLMLLAACACWVRAFVPDGGGTTETPTSRRSSVRWCVLAGLCIGGALMTKPLIGLGLPLFGALWLALAGLWQKKRMGRVLLSGTVGVAVALPWHASMVWMYGRTFWHTYVVDQSVKRATGELFEAKAWWWYFVHAAGESGEAVDPRTMWPIYGLALLGLGVVAVRWRKSKGSGRAGDALAALWMVVWMAALSAFAGKRNYYLMVVHPGTAWLGGIAVAAGLAAWATRAAPRLIERVQRGAAVAGVLVCIVLLARAPHVVRKARAELPVPERDAFMAFVREHKDRGVYNCGMPYRMAALTYIEAGVWPKSIAEREPMPPEKVPSGGLMVYRRDMLIRPEFAANLDPKDRVVFRSSDGAFAYIAAERR